MQSLKRSLFLFLTFFCLPAQILALECKPEEEIAACKAKRIGPWERSLNFGFNLAQGNADTLLANLGVRGKYEEGDEILTLTGSARYGEQNDEKNISDYQAGANFKELLSERSYFVLGSEFLRDEIADVKYRSITYPGLGFFFLKDDEFQLNTDIGPAMVFERQGDKYGNFLAVRVNEGFDWTLTEKSKLFQTLAVTISTENAEDTLVVGKAGVQAALYSGISIAQTIENRFDNLPTVGQLKNDVVVLTSLIFEF